jgi:hypothetical protein
VKGGDRKIAALFLFAGTTGAQGGEYVLFQFTTSFDNKAAAIETVTAMPEKDGTWHVGGYFIKWTTRPGAMCVVARPRLQLTATGAIMSRRG